MSESMAERVARRLSSFQFGHEDAWEAHEDMARAVIEAMREPTDAMKQDGWHELRKHNDIQTRLGNSLVGVETPTYQAMIDAALTSAKVDEAG